MRKLLYLAFSLMAIHVAAQKTYLHCGTLVDVKKLSLLNEVTIVIEGNKIIDIQKGYVAGTANDKIIDLKKQTVMPGLIDMHVHLEEETGPNRYLNGFTLNDADIAFQAAVYAERTLMSGFTAVRDLGGRGVNISLRNAINNNLTKGPRIYTAGKAIASTGGHADPTNNYRKEIMGDPGPKEGVVNGPEDAAKADRKSVV